MSIVTLDELFGTFYEKHKDLLFIIEIKDKDERGKQATKLFYETLANKYPDFSKCYYELGHLYLKKDEKINALSAFKLALKYEENNPYYQNSLAYAYVQLEQYDSAIELYKKALEANPNDEQKSLDIFST